MDNNSYKYAFSKYLIDTAIKAMEEINYESKEADKYKILDVYSGLNQSMEYVIEQFLLEKNESVREQALEQLRDKLKTMNSKQLEENIDNADFIYKGKVKAEA